MKTKIPTRAGSTFNRRRRHSTLGYASPQQFLNHWLSSQREKELAA